MHYSWQPLVQVGLISACRVIGGQGEGPGPNSKDGWPERAFHRTDASCPRTLGLAVKRRAAAEMF